MPKFNVFLWFSFLKIHFLSTKKNSQIALMQDLHPVWILKKEAQYEETEQKRLVSKREDHFLVIGEFRIPGRPRTSACFCAKARLMGVTSHQEDKQTGGNCGWVVEKKENLKRWKVPEGSKRTYKLKKSLFQTAKGKSAGHHWEKQRAWPEIYRNSGRWVSSIKIGRWFQNP